MCVVRKQLTGVCVRDTCVFYDNDDDDVVTMTVMIVSDIVAPDKVSVENSCELFVAKTLRSTIVTIGLRQLRTRI